MFDYFRMKKAQWKVKAALYGAAATWIDNSREISALLQDLHSALRDVPPEELQEALVAQLAGLVHSESGNGERTGGDSL